jgi:hypothetical protein
MRLNYPKALYSANVPDSSNMVNVIWRGDRSHRNPRWAGCMCPGRNGEVHRPSGASRPQIPSGKRDYLVPPEERAVVGMNEELIED